MLCEVQGGLYGSKDIFGPWQPFHPSTNFYGIWFSQGLRGIPDLSRRWHGRTWDGLGGDRGRGGGFWRQRHALLHHLVSRKECSDSSSKLKLLFGCALLSTSEDYKTFLDFVLAMENKSTPQAERNETDSMDHFFSGNATTNALNCHKNQDCWPT